MRFDEGSIVRFELQGGPVHGALQLLARQLGEPALDLIKPRRGCPREANVPTRNGAPDLGSGVGSTALIIGVRDSAWLRPIIAKRRARTAPSLQTADRVCVGGGVKGEDAHQGGERAEVLLRGQS